ncbi:hypothetical protein BDR07DRAFT_1406623 [Suillus spraguei]|nr:hypothetical protein BDR07DRAFT_1406623 [Suillus spraguei]
MHVYRTSPHSHLNFIHRYLPSSSTHRPAHFTPPCYYALFIVVPGSWEGQYNTLELIRVNNLSLPSERVSAGFYVSINPIRGVLSDVVILSLREVPELSMVISLPYDLDRMLGNGEVIAKLETSWNELLDCEDKLFDISISFPFVLGDYSSFTLKTVIIHPCDNQDSALLDSITVSHLNHAVQHFQLVLGQCLVGHLDQAATVSSLRWARLQDYIYIFKTSIPSPLSSAKPLHCVRRATPIIHHLFMTSLL